MVTYDKKCECMSFLCYNSCNSEKLQVRAWNNNILQGFIKGKVPAKLTGCAQDDLACMVWSSRAERYFLPACETTCLLLEMLMKSLMMYIHHKLELCKIIVHGVGKVFGTSLEKMYCLVTNDNISVFLDTPSPKNNARILGLKIKMN